MGETYGDVLDNGGIMTTGEAAAALGITRNELYVLLRAGVIRCYQIGGKGSWMSVARRDVERAQFIRAFFAGRGTIRGTRQFS